MRTRPLLTISDNVRLIYGFDFWSYSEKSLDDFLLRTFTSSPSILDAAVVTIAGTFGSRETSITNLARTSPTLTIIDSANIPRVSLCVLGRLLAIDFSIVRGQDQGELVIDLDIDCRSLFIKIIIIIDIL